MEKKAIAGLQMPSKEKNVLIKIRTHQLIFQIKC